MRKRIATWMTLAACLLSIVSTISVALYMAHRQSMEVESALASNMADELLRRADAMGAEAISAYRQLDAAHLVNPCSDEGLVLMRDIGMESRFLQAVGYVSDERLQCSSFGRYVQGLPLGPVAYVSSLGTRVRLSVDMGQGKGKGKGEGEDRRFLLFELGQYVAAIHASTMLDVFTDKPDISLGLYAVASGVPLAVRGTFAPEWIKRLDKGDRVTFFDGKQLVSIRRSPDFDLAAYVAVPADYLIKRLRAVSLVLIPVGLLLGLAVSLAVFFLARQQNSMPATLRMALKKREFILHYQPIVALDTRRMVGAEALLRWPRDGGHVRPDLFIPAAEDSGMIGQFTDYVLHQVARDAPRFIARHPDCYISINLSSPDLHDARTVDSLRRLVATPGIPAANIMVELTEHSFLDAARAAPTVKAIRALGIRVAIDDFGTGFSNLAQLATLEADYLKIDKVFIDAIGTQAPTSEVALHIIHMGESLGLTVIGEGIETEAQAQFLRDYGVGYGQGWLYARACPMVELLRTQA